MHLLTSHNTKVHRNRCPCPYLAHVSASCQFVYQLWHIIILIRVKNTVEGEKSRDGDSVKCMTKGQEIKSEGRGR